MLHEVLELMRVLYRGILADEALADQVSQVADAADEMGRRDEAKSFRAIARNHRIRAMEGRGRLAALEVEYGLETALSRTAFDDDPAT